jgi:hypothetical protein
MKYLEKFKLFESTKSIDDICKEYGIQNYTINPDGIVDVDVHVDLSFKRLEKLPLKFGKVSGNFWCHNNQLTSLEGCPNTVGGNFRCYNNQLTTLEGCPRTVGGNFWCDVNQLTTLEGLTDVFIGVYFIYDNNPIYNVTSNWLSNCITPNMDLIELFNDIGVIVGNKLYLSKLEHFHDEIGKPLPDMEEVRRYYEVIE